MPGLRICALLLLLLPATAAASDECQRWSQGAVSLQGLLTLETFPGPPNFHSIHRGDRAQREFVLVLEAPLCLRADSETETGSAAAASDASPPALLDVRRVQALMADARVEVSALGNLDTVLWLHGRFERPTSRSHYLPVLLRTVRISALPDRAPSPDHGAVAPRPPR